MEAPKEEVRSLEPALKDKQINKDLKVEGAAGKASYCIMYMKLMNSFPATYFMLTITFYEGFHYSYKVVST